jgi:sRNA-binding protein
MTPQTALAQQQIEQQRLQEHQLQMQQQQKKQQQQQRQQQRQQQQQQEQEKQQKEAKQKAPRVKQLSQELFLRLQSIFPKADPDILAVLKKNPCESDINTLSNLVMEYMDKAKDKR